MNSPTDAERKMIVNIARNEYTPLNGSEPTSAADCTCWSNSLNMGPNEFSKKSISGLISSLVKKGYVWTNGESCGLTAQGFLKYQDYQAFLKMHGYK